MNTLKLIAIFALSGVVFTSCSEKSNKNSGTTKLVPKLTSEDSKEENVVKSLQTQLVQMNQAPSLTLILVPKKDVQLSIETLLAKGGKLVYDPNNRLGSSIPFYIAELTPELVNDTDFMNSLKLKAASIDNPTTAAKPIETKLVSTNIDFTNYIPTDSVKLDALGDTKNLGEGVTVAVIDTGIDASHPAFGDRIVYWYDATQETRTELKQMSVANSSIQIDLNGESKKIVLPKEITDNKDVFAGVMQEKNFIAQMNATARNEIGYLDLNANKTSDHFLVVVTKDEEGQKIYFDVTGDLKLASLDEISHKVDYNETSKANRDMGLISFPSRNNIMKYPVLLEEEDKKLYINLGKVNGMHGTHVAGIIAADDQENNLLGAAPKADLMSMRVCSGISCTDSAIIKALYKSFYNGKVIPDVVNISLGSHEGYARGVYTTLMQDLSAKFGTVFFISASNSGPGFRSLNHFGNSGAAIMVGANVSSKTLRDQYNLPTGGNTAQENLLYFSSLGPSYTGEMKPNIIAPGAAISTVEANGGYMGQANGTSMSSPLAAGAFASMLAKSIQDGTDYKIVRKMREYHLTGSTEAKTSLLPYAYAMRDALQNGATFLKDLSTAQQGYGLINIGKSKELLDLYVDELNKAERDYFEVVINDYQKGYDRKVKIKDFNTYKLTLGLDGERRKESLAGIIAKGLDIELSKVEILSTDGSVKILRGAEATKYFSIIDRGNSDTRLVGTHVSLNNRRNASFMSRRHKESFQDGKTYLAHYKVKSDNVTVTNLLDVVHKTIRLEESNISVAAIDPSLSSTKNGFAKSKVKIGTNQFHRYPFYVDSSLNALNIKLAISPEDEGRIFIQLYNPDGREVEFKLAQKSSIVPTMMAAINTSTLSNGKVQEGVWELTVSTASSNWLSGSTYDLLVEGERFGLKSNVLRMKTDKEYALPIQLGGKTVSKVIKQDIKEFVVEKVETKSSHFSIHPLNLPTGYTGKFSITVDDKKHLWWGSVVPYLMIKKDGKFIKYEGAKGDVNGNFNISNASDELYFGLDTISNFSGRILNTASKVDVMLIFNTDKKFSPEVELESHNSVDVALLKLKSETRDDKSNYRFTMRIISGNVIETTDIDGNTVIELGKDSIENVVFVYVSN